MANLVWSIHSMPHISMMEWEWSCENVVRIWQGHVSGCDALFQRFRLMNATFSHHSVEECFSIITAGWARITACIAASPWVSQMKKFYRYISCLFTLKNLFSCTDTHRVLIIQYPAMKQHACAKEFLYALMPDLWSDSPMAYAWLHFLFGATGCDVHVVI